MLGITNQPDVGAQLRSLRIQKVVNNLITYDYFLHGKLISHMTVTKGSQVDKLHFYYDAVSRPQMVKYNGTYYTYMHNLQGDIVAILDSNGNKVVEYNYDAWGKLIGMTKGSLGNTLGTLNPFRYRGYVYDEETKLYYLRSRYYNPEWCRFVNVDSLLGKTGVVLSHNAFKYCMNNPILLADAAGNEESPCVTPSPSRTIRQYEERTKAVEEKMHEQEIICHMGRCGHKVHMVATGWRFVDNEGYVRYTFMIEPFKTESKLRMQVDNKGGKVGSFGKFSFVTCSGKLVLISDKEEDLEVQLKGVLDIATVQGGLYLHDDGMPDASAKIAAASGRITLAAQSRYGEVEAGISADAYSVGFELMPSLDQAIATGKLKPPGYAPFKCSPILRIQPRW